MTVRNGLTTDLLVLLDSGANINIVRRGLINASYPRTSFEPVQLKVASRTPMICGTEAANLSLQFWQSHSPKVDSFATPTKLSDVFYQASQGTTSFWDGPSWSIIPWAPCSTVDDS